GFYVRASLEAEVQLQLPARLHQCVFVYAERDLKLKTGLGDLEEFSETQHDGFGLSWDSVERSPDQNQDDDGQRHGGDQPHRRLREIQVNDSRRLIIHATLRRTLL